jgi:ubiquinone/menaquinone biosynthesis C-methylase UbiE
VRLARQTTGGDARIVQGAADALPFEDGEFTAISCLVAFFFFSDPVAVLREFRRVLDPERGRVAVFTTPPEMKGTPAAPYPLATRGHFHEGQGLERLAAEAGFTIARVTCTEIGSQLLFARD